MTDMPTNYTDALRTASLADIVRTIRRDWKNVNYAAKPYLDAMGGMFEVSSSYGADSGKGIVLYFLCNATAWRGPTARAIKAELNRRCKA